MRMLLLAMFTLVACLGVACGDEAPGDEAPGGEAPGDGEEWTTTASGLKYQVLRAGKAGTEPKQGDMVSVTYVGTFPDGKEFDRSDKPGRPPTFTFALGTGGVIPGWDEGVALMTIGSKYRFHVPWKLAYGENGRGTIPAKADLNFDVELVEVKAMPRFTKPDPAKQKTTESGLKYEIVEAGAGGAPSATDGVTMRFALFTQKGELLVSTDQIGRKMSGPVSVLPGMQLGPKPPAFLKEAPLLMKPGSHYRFEVPPGLCWGAMPIGPLPANSTTIWELWLESVNPIPAFALSKDDKKQKTESGLEYEILEEGKGEHPKASDTVEVHYTGWLLDGTLFDSSHGRGEAISFSLRGVIPGWTEGVQLMRPGGKARFTIPGKLAYGPKGSPPTIGPNATLVFVIELKAIK